MATSAVGLLRVGCVVVTGDDELSSRDSLVCQALRMVPKQPGRIHKHVQIVNYTMVPLGQLPIGLAQL